MREIKFRVWNKLVSVMEEVEAIEFKDLIEGREGVFTGLHYWIDAKDCELIQYTGLKDKNGTEIYEGDILQEQEGMKGKYIIVPMLGGLSIHNLRNYGQKHNELISYPTNDAQTSAWISEQEVVGNIYKNPELLKEIEK